MTEREKILDEIERFLRKTGMNATHFGIESVGRRNLLNHLRDGRGLHIDSAAKIRDYMKAHRARPTKRAEARCA